MSEGRKYLRFSLSDRIEHWVQMASFTTLAVTGLVQKFATSSVSIAIVSFFGGIENTRIIHRSAAVVLMVAVIYHLGSAGYKIFVKKARLSMLPTLDDITAAWTTFLYNLGLKDNRPQQGRYTFDEKFEYWAFVWGTVIMAITGFMLWNPIAATRLFPGEFIPAAVAAHGGEALLAVLAIIIWHFYNVHIKHFNKSMFTGYVSEETMLEEHPKELADIKTGIAEPKLSREELKRREAIFYPVYGVVAAVLMFGVYMFVTMEQTAIETRVPPEENVAVFSPLTPTPLPTPIPSPTQPPEQELIATWEGSIAEMLENSCGQCHGESGMGGLNLTDYDAVLSGGDSGPLITSGDAQNSLLVENQSSGGHPGQLSGEQLSLIREWINQGAPRE